MSAEEDRRRALSDAEDALKSVSKIFQQVDQRKRASAALAGTPERQRESVAWLQGREGATIAEFSNCLAGLEPSHYINGLGNHPAERAAKQFEDILTRSVGVSLQATNANEKLTKQRFPVAQLLEVSKRLNLGFASELGVAKSAQAVVPDGRDGDVTRFSDWLVSQLRERGITRKEFCANGSMAALYRVYREHFQRTAPPYSDSIFGGRLNRAGFKFGAGARGHKAHQYVLDILEVSPK